MRALRILKRNIRDSFKSVFRNFSLSMASIICTTITLILVAFAVIVSVNVYSFTKDIEKELVIVAFLENEATAADINKIEQDIKNIENVEEVIFADKESERQRLIKENSSLSSVLSAYDKETNPLLNRFDITTSNAEEIPSIAEAIKKMDFIQSANYGENVVEKILPAFSVIQKATIVLVIALVLVTVFLISNTIKITIFARRDEISIMRLVGASNTVIRLPFLFEGLIVGILGALIPVIISIYGYIILHDALNGYVISSLIKLTNPFPFVFYLSTLLLVIGGIVGMIGSYHAVRRYLKV